MARLFFALPIPDAARAQIAALAEALRATRMAASWVPPPNYHVTLRFLGDLDEPRATAILADAREAAAAAAPFPVALAAAGAFPSIRRPHVLWAGGEAEAGAVDLATRLEEIARAHGLPPLEAPFRLHVTVARVKARRAPRAIADAVESWSTHRFGAWEAAEIVLYESQLGSGPPRYVTRARLPLGPPGRLAEGDDLPTAARPAGSAPKATTT